MSIEAFDEILMEVEEGFERALKALDHDFQRIRTGRAAPQMVDHIQVEVYGSFMPLRQVAAITVPEASQLMIKPWDKSTLHAIERAIAASDLGVTPQSDGTVIRLNLPPLSSERRKQLAAQAKDLAEKAKVSLRNHRRDGIRRIEAQGKELKAPEDETKKATEQVSELLKAYETKVEKALKAKSDDILSF